MYLYLLLKGKTPKFAYEVGVKYAGHYLPLEGILQIPIYLAGHTEYRTRLLPYATTVTFGTPRVMGAIESLGCNWWSNMHQIDA